MEMVVLYEEVLDRKCMGIQVRKAKDLKGEESIAQIEQKILDIVKVIFANSTIKKQFEDDKNILDKIVLSLLINLTMLVDYYPEEKARNIEYLTCGVEGLFDRG